MPLIDRLSSTRYVRRARQFYRAVNAAYVTPLRCRHLDGGTMLAIKIQNALGGKRGVVRIDRLGEVLVNGKSLGSSYGTEHLGSLMTNNKAEQRELVIVGEPNIGGRKIELFISGINTGNLEGLNALQGCATVYVKDYNLFSLLQKSNVSNIKVSPRLEFSDEQFLTISDFFKQNISVLRDFRWFNPTQRVVVLRLLSRNLLDGLFNFWEVLGPQEKTRLLEDLTRIDVEQVAGNIETHRQYIETAGRETASNLAQIKGALGLPDQDSITNLPAMAEAGLSKIADYGRQHKETGRFGVVVMAAGAAARFGQGPKALVVADKERTFMRIAAEDVLSASRQAGKAIPLFVMISPANGDAIKKHFNDNNYFGLRPDQVFFFYQTDVSPKIYPDGNLALTADKRGIDFAPTGHGFVVKGLKNQVLPICRDLGVKTVVIKNIDNLGSTVRDISYDEVLGHHLNSGRGLTVELVAPKTAIDPVTKEKRLLDKGGGALSLDGRNVLVELFAVPPGLREKVVENPFNTLTLTLDLDALERAEAEALPWYITHKDFTVRVIDRHRRFQFEQLLGDLTHQIATNFVIVAREGAKGRFLPVKLPGDLARVQPVFSEMEEHKPHDRAE